MASVPQVTHSRPPRARRRSQRSLSWLRSNASLNPPAATTAALSYTGNGSMSASPSGWVRTELPEEPNGCESAQAISRAEREPSAGRGRTRPLTPTAPCRVISEMQVAA